MSHPPAARPLYLGAAPERCLAFLHEPTATVTAAPARSAVLLCPPFGWEDICSYRSRREWAEQLARAGHTTLRIDLPGSGNSAGGPNDPARLSRWSEAILDACAWLRGASGAHNIAVIGIGLSGLLAARAALQGAQIDELILWAAPSRGRTLVRELRAFSRLEVANIVSAGEQEHAAGGGAAAGAEAGVGAEAGGGLAANGYLLSAETVAALERLDLAEIEPAPLAHTKRVLLLGRDGLKLDERLAPLFERGGAEATVAAGPGYGAMMLEPQDAQAPTEVFATVASWLEQENGAGEPVGATPAGVQDAAGAGAGDETREQLELSHAGVRLRERTVSLERAEGRLFGVLTEPADRAVGLCAVLLNAGPQRHTGPNRMWVEIARRWAARGVPTLRIDLAGIGDSDGDAAALVRVATLYRPEYVQQVLAVLDMLGEQELPERFLLLGLCAGAHWSLHAALQDERVAGIAMLNPRALVWDEWAYTQRRTQDLRERLLRASTWRRLLSGELTLARHLETARAIAGRALTAPRRRRARLAEGPRADGGQPADADEALFDALRERDQRALLLLTGKEPLREQFERSGLFERLERWPNIELVLAGTSADTHTLTPPWLQREVHELVDRALERELQRLPARLGS